MLLLKPKLVSLVLLARQASEDTVFHLLACHLSEPGVTRFSSSHSFKFSLLGSGVIKILCFVFENMYFKI